LSILDTIAPPRGPKRRRYGVVFFAKTTFYMSVSVGIVFVLVSYIFFNEVRELQPIPATQGESEILAQVHEYLKQTDVTHYTGRAGEFETLNCWTEFGEEEFTVEYLDFGSWRIDAYYNLVRYYWRVDDLSLEVTRDSWLRTNNPKILC
jgi:hypothetical protein